jgi:acyl-coenzyme A thioesterase PaaI-like protein
MLRPGGTVSGPSLMALADTAMWAAVLGAVGPVAMTVTTHLDIDFLRFVGPHDVVADARLLKLGKRLAVGDVLLTADGATEPCARASLTYSIPPATASDPS